MAETISNIIIYAVGAAFVLAHLALFGWGLSLAKPESRRAIGLFGTGLLAMLFSVAGCAHYISR